MAEYWIESRLRLYHCNNTIQSQKLELYFCALKWVFGLPCFKRSLTMLILKKTDAVATEFLVAAAVCCFLF